MVDDGEEDYVLYGTPIIREDELSSRKKKKEALNSGQVRRLPPWKQEVTDEEGRRRFHGAFTGGYSAGYYNTVGSKEGWTPQTFTSSRKKRADVKTQSVLNFLDDDEKMEFEANEVRASAQFDTFGFTAAEMARKQAEKEVQKRPSAIPGPLPDEIVVPVAESIGVKLLTKMGWRHGRTVGTSYISSVSDTRREGRKAVLALAFEPEGNSKNTSSLHSQLDKNEEISEFDADGTKIARSTPVFVLNPKSDLFGLGYDPYRDAPEFREKAVSKNFSFSEVGNNKVSQSKRSLFRPNAGKTASGFGLGALEDIDEDDEDIYESSVDVTLASEEYEVKPSQKHELIKEREALSDGLPAFILAAVSSCHREWFNPPIVPPGFVPFHKFEAPLELELKFSEPSPPETDPPDNEEMRLIIEGLANFVARSGKTFEDLSKEKNAKNPLFSFLFGGPGYDYYRRKLWEERSRLSQAGKAVINTSSEKKDKKLNAEERGRILGETPLERTSAGVEKNIPASDISRLQSILSDTFTKSSSMDTSLMKPFENDPAKQARFEQFLKDKFQGGIRSSNLNDDRRTEVERAQERLDFEAAVELVEKGTQSRERFGSSMENKDFLSIVGNRFTSGGIETMESKPQQSSETEVKLMHKSIPRREEHVWRPSAILCKRFHLVDPYAGKPPPLPKVRSKMDSIILISNPARDVTEMSSLADDQCSLSKNSDSKLEADSEELKIEGDMENKDAFVKKPIDLYKAIFSDESDSETDENVQKESDVQLNNAEGANATLNRLIAGDFLESLGKELGLKVPSNLEKTQLRPDIASESKESQRDVEADGRSDREVFLLPGSSAVANSTLKLSRERRLNQDQKGTSEISSDAQNLDSGVGKAENASINEKETTDYAHDTSTANVQKVATSDQHRYEYNSFARKRGQESRHKYNSSDQDTEDDERLKKKRKQEHSKSSSRRHHKRKHRSSSHDSSHRRRNREKSRNGRKKEERKRHRRDSSFSSSSSD